MKPRRPRAVVLCPTRELSEQVFVHFLIHDLKITYNMLICAAHLNSCVIGYIGVSSFKVCKSSCTVQVYNGEWRWPSPASGGLIK